MLWYYVGGREAEEVRIFSGFPAAAARSTLGTNLGWQVQ